MLASAQSRPNDTSRRATRAGALLGSTALTLAAFTGHAFAQTAPAAAPAAVGEVIVTGSRAALNGFKAPTPTTVVSGATINQQAVTGVSALLNQQPAFKPTRSPQANATNTSSPAQSTADLRGLGGQRTLVLINGARAVPFAPASNLGVPTAVDLNLIPTIMIDRVEVVTGGASAQYGSDAVAGVVNIILKNKFDGLEVRAQTGESQEGDSIENRIAAIGGTAFAGGRGHVMGAIDWENNTGVGDIYSRKWGRQEWMIVSNPSPATNGQPAFILAPHARTDQGAGGIITGPTNFSLKGYTFNPDGSTRLYNAGAYANGNLQIGGEGNAQSVGVSLVPKVRRLSAYGRADYDLTDNIHAYVEGSYSQSEGILLGIDQRITSVTVKNDNPYLPAAVKAAMAAQGVTSFTMSRAAEDLGNNVNDITNKTPHGLIGFDGDLGGTWKWDAHAEYGENQYKGVTTNNPILARYPLAEDAVLNPANGQIVCRSTLTNPTNGCVPLNLIGNGSPSAAAKAYVNGSGQTNVLYKQTDIAANLRGEPFSTWAGPVSVATGLEYRKESEVVTADAIGAANGFGSTGNAVPYSGQFDVTEGYVETLVPLARDMPFAKSLVFNGAVRVAQYSSVGQQTTWKAGLTWEPVDGLRLRTTRSEDIRAPAIFELYSPGSNVTNSITVLGKSANIPQNTSLGNPDLKAEDAKTFTIGAVLEPHGAFQGLSMSLDYFDINLQKAITSLSGATIASLCTLGDKTFCNFFTFDGAGNPTSLTGPAVNAASFETIGYDFVLSYRKDLSDWFSWASGTSTTSLSGTYTQHAWVDLGTGTGAIDRAGENGAANLGAVPKVRANLSETYAKGPASITGQLLYVSSGTIDNTYNTGNAANTININHVDAYFDVNLYGSYQLNQKIQLFGRIDNLLNQDPPVDPYAVLNSPTYGAYYDKIGRSFQIGVDYKY